jgi:hypothetical protein
MVMYIVCKFMDIQISGGFGFEASSMSMDTFYRRGKVRLMDFNLDLVLQYPSKPSPLSSLVTHFASYYRTKSSHDAQVVGPHCN